jgi:putative transposase
VNWNKRYYYGDWMQEHGGLKVQVRFMPHHAESIEVFDTRGRYLGSASLSDGASTEQIADSRRTRARNVRRLAADLAKAEKLRRETYAAVSVPAPARALGALTAAEAAAETEYQDLEDLAAQARPDLIPHDPVPDSWTAPTTEAP